MVVSKLSLFYVNFTWFSEFDESEWLIASSVSSLTLFLFYLSYLFCAVSLIKPKISSYKASSSSISLQENKLVSIRLIVYLLSKLYSPSDKSVETCRFKRESFIIIYAGNSSNSGKLNLLSPRNSFAISLLTID